jgi:FkbM family methyltransferase
MLMEFIRRLSFQPSVIRASQVLHLRRTLGKVYFRLARPHDGVVRLEAAGTEARFYIRTPAELRNLDPAGAFQDERSILEHVLRTLEGGGTFYDIGSNVGLYAVLVAKALGERGGVIAFEPFSEAYAHLQCNLELNGLTNVHLFRKALGQFPTQGRLYRGGGNADSSLVVPPSGVDLGYELVDVVRGDDLVISQKLPLPRAVKIDVEGYEYDVIQGLRSTLAERGCELVCCEIHPRLLPPSITTKDVLDALESLGYGQISIRPRKDTLHAIAHRAGHGST